MPIVAGCPLAVFGGAACALALFELSVEPGANALQIFEHPYAYAAWRGVDYRLADLRDAA
jgi:hypothetical protein